MKCPNCKQWCDVYRHDPMGAVYCPKCKGRILTTETDLPNTFDGPDGPPAVQLEQIIKENYPTLYKLMKAVALVTKEDNPPHPGEKEK